MANGAQRSTPGLAILLILAAGHFGSVVVRNLPGIVAGDLQAAFTMGDAAFGLLHGPAFVMVNVLGTIVAAVFIDRLDRFRTAAWCMAGWGLGSLAFAFATSIEGLIAARILVGLSQAAFAPCAVSLIIDRCGNGFGRPLSIFTAGSALGRSAGIMLGGTVIALVALRPSWMGEGSDWRVAYAMLSLPSLGLAAVLFCLRDRRTGAARRGGGLGRSLAWAWHRRDVLGPYLVAAASLILITHATTAWMPSVFRRVLEIDAAEAALLSGSAVLVGAPVGHVVAGIMLDRWTAAGRAPPGLILLALMAIATLGLVLALCQTALMLLLTAGGLAMVLGMGALVALAGFQPITPSARRGSVTALYFAIVGLIGMGLGPPVVGLVSEARFGSGAGLLPAIAVVIVVSALIGSVAAWRATAVWPRLSRQDLQRD